MKIISDGTTTVIHYGKEPCKAVCGGRPKDCVCGFWLRWKVVEDEYQRVLKSKKQLGKKKGGAS